jgi:hypothetical protein
LHIALQAIGIWIATCFALVAVFASCVAVSDARLKRARSRAHSLHEIHPSRRALVVWFDGHDDDVTAEHVAECQLCQREVQRLRPIWEGRWVRGRTRLPLLRPAVASVLVIALLTSLGLATRRPTAPDLGPLLTGVRSDRGAAASFTQGTPSQQIRTAQTSAARQRLNTATPPLNTPVVQAVAPLTSLSLGVLVPRTGPFSSEGDEVVRAVREAVAEANADAAKPAFEVTVQVVYPEDEGALTDLSRRIDALVGGFGEVSIPGISWLLPADPDVTGPNVVAGEMSARAAGVRLGADLVARDFSGIVGVIQDDGPEASLADGLSTRVQTEVVKASEGTSCDQQILTLRNSGVTALALAMSPESVAACVKAAQRVAFRPDGGLLVPPSAAYEHLPLFSSTLGIRTVLGFPWPGSADSGAADFDSSVRGSRSYRALISFAAARLAIQVAQSRRSISYSSINAGDWRGDLYWLDRGVNRNAKVVELEGNSWTTPDTYHG